MRVRVFLSQLGAAAKGRLGLRVILEAPVSQSEIEKNFER